LIEALKNGGIVVGSSDTIMGLLSDVSQAGFDALNFIKGRAEKPYLILISSKEQVKNFIESPLTAQLELLLDCCWPGPLTIVVRAKKNLPAFLISKAGTIALRVPNHRGLQALLPHFEGGLFSTSANLAGGPVPVSLDELDSSVAARVACMVADSNEAKVQNSLPSTILDCSGPDMRVLREGSYSVDFLESVCGQKLLR
jgi:L-threonylcarbamoyladenylate synthase